MNEEVIAEAVQIDYEDDSFIDKDKIDRESNFVRLYPNPGEDFLDFAKRALRFKSAQKRDVLIQYSGIGFWLTKRTTLKDFINHFAFGIYPRDYSNGDGEDHNKLERKKFIAFWQYSSIERNKSRFRRMIERLFFN